MLNGMRERYRAFIEEHVYAAEPVLALEDESADAAIAELRSQGEGRWALGAAPPARGRWHGEGFLYYADLNEEIGRSLWAQLVFNCQAPDAGNGEILHMFGTPEQKEQFLRPLVEGDTRSFFSMTEPEVSGADPTGLQTHAVLDDDEWVIDGAQVVLVGRRGRRVRNRDGGHRPRRRAAPAHVTDPRARRHAGVEGRAVLGVRAPRPRLVDPPGGLVRGVRVPAANILGERGDGFRIAQKRLGPGRIHHVMRWLGQMQRAFDLMCSYSLEREAFGGPLAEKQTIQNWIAESAAEIQACRLMTIEAAQQDRRRRRGAGRDLGDQVLRGAGPERRDRPRGAGARRASA